jgi:hypothetical protein
VAIPRYTATVAKAEAAAEDAVISSIMAGLESYATEQLMATGRRFWPNNPWDALETKPAGYSATGNGNGQDADGIADSDGEWTFTTANSVDNITHMRGDNSVHHWDYTKGVQSGNNAAPGSMGVRQAGAN